MTQLHKLCKYALELEQSGGGRGWRQPEVGREGEGRSFHDITPLLCHYVSEQHSFSMMLEVVQGGWSGGRGGAWGIRVLEVKILTRYHNLPHLNLESRITRLWRLWALHNFIWDVGVDAGGRYDRGDVLLSCREVEFDSSWGDDLGNGEGTSPLVVQFLHGVVRGVVLET